MKAVRLLGIIALGFVGFVVVLATLEGMWRSKHEELAHQLCDSIPVGTPASIAKERARAMAKVVAGIEVGELSIGLVFLNPYSPGDRVVCGANIFNDKVVNSEVRVEN